MIRDSRPCGRLDANDSPLFKGKADVLSRVPEPAEAAVRQDWEEAIARGYVVRHTDGSPYVIPDKWFAGSLLPDFTNPEACRWWFDKRQPLLEMGVEGFKTDGGEFLFGSNIRLADGTPGGEAHNRYPMQYVKAYHRWMKENGVEGVTFSRAGYTGAQTVPIHWAGDQLSTGEELRGQLSAGLSAGLSGVLFWSFDIGGFAGEIPDRELYLRATAMGCFCPVMQWHAEPRNGQFFVTGDAAWNNDRSPWNLASRWNDPSIAEIACAFARLRERLRPMLYEEAKACVKEGRPMIAHLCLDFPDDEQALACGDEYLLGRRLLVAPIVQPGAEGRRVYLPQGRWKHFFNGKVYGAAVVDQSPITGEFVPVEKREGDEVFAGTVVKSGNIHVQAAKVGDQTVISRIVGMVEASELKKAPIQRYADKFSNYLVPLNFLLCLSVWLVTKNPQKALKMLVIDYSCGIKLSTATAFSAAINTAVKQGVLIKGGTFIEQMSSANTVLLDKTGTITEGRPRIVSAVVLKEGMSEKEVLSYAMAAEETSTHPLAGAIMRYGRELGASPKAHGDVVTEVSRGSRTLAGKKTVRVGNIEYMRENGVKAAAPLPGETGAIPNYVGVGSEIVAVLYAMDSPRENVRRAINSLRYDGVGDIELLTGDMESQARTVAEQVGADGYRAQLLPEQKAEAVLKLQVQGNGVVMVGDGINDAPALAYADVGISMGSKSTDIAMETSDVIINRDDPMMIPALRRLSRATMRIVHQNFALVIAINSVGLILGAASGISVMMSALLHNSSTILVVANSLRLMFMKPGDGRA